MGYTVYSCKWTSFEFHLTHYDGEVPAQNIFIGGGGEDSCNLTATHRKSPFHDCKCRSEPPFLCSLTYFGLAWIQRNPCPIHLISSLLLLLLLLLPLLLPLPTNYTHSRPPPPQTHTLNPYPVPTHTLHMY